MKIYNHIRYTLYFKSILLSIILLGFVTKSHAQIELHSAGYYVLNSEISGSHVYEASSYIDLKQSFRYQITPTSVLLWCKIDENIVGPTPYQNELSGETRPLNKNFAVGSLPGAFDVTSSGSATYSVPIEVSPGTKNMTPDIAITYNSSAGYGLLGMGFDISGFSSISRCGKDLYHDGIINDVKFDATDKFALDGERLIRYSGTYGEVGSEYRPENQYYTKVLLKSNNQQLYFEVWTKDGYIKEYGNTDDSKVERNGNTTGVYSWKLNKIRDYYGNYIKFNYHKDKENGEYYIENILYTGNDITGMQPYNEIKFFYDISDNNNITYQAGSKFTQKVILRKIKTFCEGKLVKIYQFKYAKNFYSHLNEILLSAGDGSCLNSTVINWGAKTDPITTTFDGNQTGEGSDLGEIYKQYPTCFADVNGDGMREVVVFETDWDKVHWMNWRLMKYSNNESQNKHLVSLNSGTLNPESGVDTLKEFNFVRAIPVDFDKDGKEEILILSFWHNPDPFSMKGFCRLYKFDQNNALHKVSEFPCFEYFSRMQGPSFNQWKQTYNSLIDYNFHIADFNGDGFLDIIYTTSDFGFGYKTFKYANSHWQLETIQANLIIPNFFAEDLMNPGDFDGDGKAELNWFGEIIKIDDNGIPQFIHSTQLQTYIDNNSFPPSKEIEEIKTGDFNGDGISDLLFRVEERTFGYPGGNDTLTTFKSHWNVAYGQGIVYNANKGSYDALFDIKDFQDGWNYEYKIYTRRGVPGLTDIIYYTGTNHRLYVADLNSDGKADIVDAAFVFNNTPTPTSPPKLPTTNLITHSWLGKILISNGTDFENINPLWNTWWENPNQILYVPDCGFYPEEYYIFNDFTGNGNLQIFNGLKTYDVKPNLEDQKVVSVTDGYNSTTKVSYKTLVDPQVYTKGSGSQYPISDVTAPVCVVSNVNYDNGTELGTNINYKYEGLKIHNRGKGTLGFMKNTITNMLTNNQTINTFEIVNSTFNDLMLKNTLNRNTVNDFTYSESTNYNYTRVFTLDDWYIHYSYPNEVISKNYLTNAMSTSFYSYDMYMNITNSTSSVKQIDATANEWESETNYNPYDIINNSVCWRPGLLRSASTTTTKNGESSITKTKNFTYNDKGDLISIVDEPTNDNKTTTILYYNNIGNIYRYEVIVKNSVNGNDETRYVNLDYDPQKERFITKVTNSKGHNAVFTFDPCFGSALTTTDANNNQSTLTYDVFGRPKTITSPDNNTTTATIEWVTGQGNNGLFLIRAVMPGNAPVISYYDRLMRPVRLESKGFNSETLYKDYTYDEYGFRNKESLPYFSQNEAGKQWVNINYDPLTSRLMTVQGPAVNMAYTYTQNKTTLTDNIMGVSQWILTDAAGNITQSHDNGGTIIFDYNSQGLIKDIIDPAGNTRSMEYDIFGNQVSLDDPDAGLTSYTYDAFGQMRSQTDARGAVTQLSYDELGRLLERKESMDGLTNFKTTNYTYDSRTKGIGMLSSITNSEGYAEEYNYDIYSRPVNSKTTIDGVEYTKSIVYDKIGRVKQYNYPSGFGIKYNYNPSTGDLVSMLCTDNNQTVWQCAEVNALGQIEKFVLGNGLVTRNSFDQETHMLTGIKTGTESSNNWNVQNLAYIYNEKLQLQQRKDNRSGYMLIESFTYDNLNRLTSSKVGSSSPITVDYDINGNITNKSDVGSYSYELPKPHALSKIVSNDGSNPPENEQNITYSEFGKVNSIKEGKNRLYYSYGAGQQRIKSELYENNTLVKLKYYLGNYEKETTNGVSRELHYISAPSGLVGIMERKNGENKMYYVHTDMLGSFNSITDENGNILEEMNFDAWGKRRNPTDWSYNNLAAGFLFDRGYTGHEMLDEFGLINMNGRVYDPTNARFLSPDPFVQDPFNTQSYNRYSYCWNNPVMYTDPSGYEVGIPKWNPWGNRGEGCHVPYQVDPGGTSASTDPGEATASTSAFNTGSGGGGGNRGTSYASRKNRKSYGPVNLPDPNHYDRPLYRPNVSSASNTDGNVVKPGDGDKWDPDMKIYGGDVISYFKEHKDLYKENYIYKKVFDQLSNNKSVMYTVKSDGDYYNYRESGSYNDQVIYLKTKMVEPILIKGTIFEEVFHAGQDDYYTKNNINHSLLEEEFEAKFANIVSGICKDEFDITVNCPNIIKALKNGEKLTPKIISKDFPGIKKSVLKLLETYTNIPESEYNLDPNHVFDYLQTLIE